MNENLPEERKGNFPAPPQNNVDTDSMQEKLGEFIGRFFLCKCLVGTNNLVTISGIMKAVGNSYFILVDPCTQIETVCDIYSVKFLSIYPEGTPDSNMYCNFRHFIV